MTIPIIVRCVVVIVIVLEFEKPILNDRQTEISEKSSNKPILVHM
jgi:hypothetical protein